MRTSAANTPLPAPDTDWVAASEQWLKAYKAGYDAMLAIGRAALAGVQPMQLTQNFNAARAVTNYHHLSELVAVQSNLATAYLESTMRYWTTVSELTRQTQAEIVKIVAGRVDAGTRSGAEGLRQAPTQQDWANRSPSPGRRPPRRRGDDE